MIVEYNKTLWTYESDGFINDFYSENDIKLSTLAFEGPTGFNTKYVDPILKLIGDNKVFYKCIFVKGKNVKNKANAMYIISIANMKDTQFIFAPLKALGLSLNELRLGYSIANNNMCLDIPIKIKNLISKLDTNVATEFTMYLICLTKLLIGLAKFNVSVNCNSEKYILNTEELTELYNYYGTFAETGIVDCNTLLEDCEFDEVYYYCTKSSKLIQPITGLRTSCEFVYNTITDSKDTCLWIINKNFTPNEYFKLSLNNISVETNSALSYYLMFDTSEFIPYTIFLLQEKCPDKHIFIIKHTELNEFYKDIKELNISVSIDKFDNIVDKYPNISENFDTKIYENVFNKNTILSTDFKNISLIDEYKDDMYAQQLYKQVKDYYNKFDLKDLVNVSKGLATGEIYAMLFYGEAGSGKSTAARVLSNKCGLPFVSINCSTNIEESDMFGTMIPNPEKKSSEDPEFIWKDGPATLCIRNGYTLIIEELTFARPGILGKLNSLLDESRQIDLPNGEVLKAHPNFRIIATCNIAYEGNNRLNKALIDRFNICKKFELLSQKEITSLIKERTGFTDITKINKIIDVFNAIRKYSEEQNLGLVVSIRRLLDIFNEGKYYKSAKDAVINTLVNHAFIEEQEHLEFFIKTILNAFDLDFKLN